MKLLRSEVKLRLVKLLRIAVASLSEFAYGKLLSPTPYTLHPNIKIFKIFKISLDIIDYII